MSNSSNEHHVPKNLYKEEFTSDFIGFPRYSEEISKDTPMRNYFRGKTILLTGGTGFLGQLYTEKTLRSEVKCLYLLARPKKGIHPKDRIKELFSGKHFSKLYKQDKNYFDRIRIIEGDLGQLKLGISESDMRDIEENVDIIIHAAANVRFDETLHKLLMINLRGTRELLKIAENIKKLQAFAYISTAFSHAYRHEIDEQLYEPPVDPETILKFAEKYNDNPDQSFEIIQERIIRPWPNTYTYSKALSESLVGRFCEKFPICIIRPTIVISTYEDPIPGWCNNIYGLNGVLIACGMGVLRIVPCNTGMKGDIICADFVINSTLAAIWATHKDAEENKIAKKSPEIYNVCSSEDRSILWGKIYELEKIFAENPSKVTFWKATGHTTTCPVMWKVLTFYYHVIPGIFFDFILKLKGKKIRLLPVYRKVQKFMVALKYFMTTEFKFTNSNMKRVLAKMSKEDQEFYPSDVRRYTWDDFCFDYANGLQVYIGHQKFDDLPKARQRYKKLCVLHAFVLTIYYGIHLFVLYQILDFYNVIDYCKASVTDIYEFVQRS